MGLSDRVGTTVHLVICCCGLAQCTVSQTSAAPCLQVPCLRCLYLMTTSTWHLLSMTPACTCSGQQQLPGYEPRMPKRQAAMSCQRATREDANAAVQAACAFSGCVIASSDPEQEEASLCCATEIVCLCSDKPFQSVGTYCTFGLCTQLAERCCGNGRPGTYMDQAAAYVPFVSCQRRGWLRWRSNPATHHSELSSWLAKQAAL